MLSMFIVLIHKFIIYINPIEYGYDTQTHPDI